MANPGMAQFTTCMALKSAAPIDAAGDLAPRRRPSAAAGESRRGLTVVELALSVAVLAMVSTAVAALAGGVRQGSEFTRNSATMTQHARVTLERITRHIENAWATEANPGVVVVHETIGGAAVPIALVAWRPTSGTPANLAGPPLVRELLIITTDPADPRRLLEVRAPSNSSTTALETLDSASGRSLIASILASASSQKVLLTELLRTTAVSGNATRRGVIWFARRLLPTAAHLAAGRSGTQPWGELPWPQGIYGGNGGLRQVWVRIELQLAPPGAALESMAVNAMPYFGSAALYYEVLR